MRDLTFEVLAECSRLLAEEAGMLERWPSAHSLRQHDGGACAHPCFNTPLVEEKRHASPYTAHLNPIDTCVGIDRAGELRPPGRPPNGHATPAAIHAARG